MRNMSRKNTEQILKCILGLTVAILIFHMCDVESNESLSLQFSYTDEAQHHIRQKREDSYTEYLAEIEINASSISVIDYIKSYLKSVQNNFTIGNVTIFDTRFTTVCNLVDTGYKCTCEDQYFWPCNMCRKHGSCSTNNDTCSCINAYVDRQHCQLVGEMEDMTACMHVVSDTTTAVSTSTATSSTSAAPLTPVYDKVISLSLKMNEMFDTSLTKPDDANYIKKTGIIQKAIEQGYEKLPNYKKGSAKIFRFRSGSVIADYTINATNNNLDLSSANAQVSKTLFNAGILVAQNAFEESVEKMLATKANYYPHQSMELRCTRPESAQGTMKWRVNDKDPAENKAKYSITDDSSTLTVKDVSESDNGRYSCIIESGTIPYVQWQNVVIQLRPNIIVDKTEIKLQCADQTVSLRCCAESYPIEWHPIPSNDAVDSEPGCIKLQHKILSTSCGTSESFTCRLKNMKELETFDYYDTSTKVQTVREFDCQNETLGVGKIDDIVKGLCEKGLEGHITYKCQTINSKNDWISIQRECVVEAIKDLEKKAEVLVVEQIPAFLANLSNTAENYTTEITQSAATVQTIVEMLVKVADISQTVTIDIHVMEDFLQTVDIIVSDNTLTAWQNITKDDTTAKTSTDLLQAIENISDRLSGDNFTINESSIQLKRATIENTFIETSRLPNSTTQVVIPNVVKPTLITVIFFTKLDQILPTRNTSNNDNRTSQNHINGDVVVVKVNETINNISFAFDITNTSLGNPQCVFWNFSLDRWDSTGCKVKISGNEQNKVTCDCNHTTSFSILMSPFGNVHPILDYITYIGVAISIACLILCLIIETIVWKSVTRNNTSHMRHVSLVNIAVSLLIADIWFIIGAAILNPGKPTPVNPCSAAVFFMHFFYLALFFWMFISALLLLYRTVMVFSQMSRTKMMVIAFTVGYGAPLLIAVITVASTAGAGRYIWTRDACWLNWNESKALLAFVVPALTIVAFNIMVVVVVVYKMLRRGSGATPQPDQKHVLVVIVRCVAILTPIFGLTWGFGIGTMVSPNVGVHVVFTILNSFQGFFVLVFGTLLDSKVREALAGKLSLMNLSSTPTRSTNVGISSSSGLGFFERLRRRNVYNMSNPSAARSANSTGASETLNP
ncbi:adhesion G protein-coupled receptor F5-like isoform X1 [Triplophysa rosa]|uniref:adhesion G protein-coupled receptor F5-like isoform X1 n=2 Tax=Triplophysa rosa TaxID=992332 RepID=UPI002545F99D|nr:adhesion G protein-coupled receptor F5-like isoform X1 [Triplophysa rosa]XP_057208582.1 adhesion G protein-coupled receptor F5-like isoform X1 [Triplophysa rosa]XP_057208583.1 adhesion G protein-coupled receptor F5-like isoform X1 [Triplophysa rosa]